MRLFYSTDHQGHWPVGVASNGDRRVSDLDDVGVDGVSGGLNNTQPLPHRPDGLFNQTEEQAS